MSGSWYRHLKLTTVPGFSHSVARRGAVRTHIWYWLGLVGITLTCFLISHVVEDYFRYEVNTKVNPIGAAAYQLGNTSSRMIPEVKQR